MTEPQPLKGKIVFFSKEYNCFFELDVASAVEFYKKYKEVVWDFQRDFPKEYLDYMGSLECWKNWLLDYSFADVVKKK